MPSHPTSYSTTPIIKKRPPAVLYLLSFLFNVFWRANLCTGSTVSFSRFRTYHWNRKEKLGRLAQFFMYIRRSVTTQRPNITILHYFSSSSTRSTFSFIRGRYIHGSSDVVVKETSPLCTDNKNVLNYLACPSTFTVGYSSLRIF